MGQCAYLQVVLCRSSSKDSPSQKSKCPWSFFIYYAILPRRIRLHIRPLLEGNLFASIYAVVVVAGSNAISFSQLRVTKSPRGRCARWPEWTQQTPLIRVFLILPAADKNLATHTFRGRRLDMSSLVRLCWAV